MPSASDLVIRGPTGPLMGMRRRRSSSTLAVCSSTTRKISASLLGTNRYRFGRTSPTRLAMSSMRVRWMPYLRKHSSAASMICRIIVASSTSEGSMIATARASRFAISALYVSRLLFVRSWRSCHNPVAHDTFLVLRIVTAIEASVTGGFLMTATLSTRSTDDVDVNRIPRLVSPDDHIIEPANLWQDRLPERYRDVGPR